MDEINKAAIENDVKILIPGARNFSYTDDDNDTVLVRYECDGITPDDEIIVCKDTVRYWKDGERVRPHDPMDNIVAFL